MTGTEAGPALIRRISMNIVLVSDLDRSIEFYRDRLGLELLTRSTEWAEFRAGETHLALQAGGRPGVAYADHVAGKLTMSFEVADVVEAYDRLSARGVRFTQRPAEQAFGILAVLCDPDGLEILLFERR